jgi:hypothetical protein
MQKIFRQVNTESMDVPLPFYDMTTVKVDDKYEKAREDWQRRKHEQEARLYEYMHHIKSTSNKFLLVFFCDATGSMSSYMRLMRDVVKDLSKLLYKNFEGLQIRFMVVLYQDPVDSETDSHQSFVTSQEKEFRQFMDDANASGGGDGAEDIAGGLENLTDMLKSEKDTSDTTLLVIHILDAPAHGFADGRVDDNHDTDIQRERLRAAVKKMVVIGKTYAEFEYHYLGIRSSTLPECFKITMRDMIFANLDESTSISDVFKEVDPKQDFGASLMQSTFTSISASVKHAFTDPFAVQPDKTTAIDDFTKFGLSFTNDTCEKTAKTAKSYPTDDNIAILNPLITRAKKPNTGRTFLYNLIEYCKMTESFDVFQAAKTKWWSHFHSKPGKRKLETDTLSIDRPLLFLECNAFGRGKEHIVYHGRLASLQSEDQVKELKSMTRSGWNNLELTFHPVIVKFNLASEYAVNAKLEIYATIKFLLDAFNHLNKVKDLKFIHMDIIAPFILEMSSRTSIMSRGKPVFVSPKSGKVFDYTLLGEYSLAEFPSQYNKWINNNGVFSAHMIPSISETYTDYFCVIHAFILYCWRVTCGNFVPSDFQGKLVTEADFKHVGEHGKTTTILLTDMACSAKNKDAFDADVNLGELFVSKIARDAYDTFSTAMSHRFKEFVKAMDIKGSDFENI